MPEQHLIRNWCVVAHIDHGKSTLADRILEITHAVSQREMREQYLDRMDIERERGITIKAAAVTLQYPAKDGKTYTFNLIDTPGHVDFTYEVSRALLACEGAVLVVDASQGIEAQTLANLHLALEADLEIIPVVNKIDLPAAQPEKVAEEIQQVLGSKPEEIFFVSGKTGEGVEELLDAVVRRVPPPSGDPAAPTRALIFDSTYDAYRGVISYVRVVDGSMSKRSSIRMMATKAEHSVEEIGVMAPDQKPMDELGAGEVGYLISGIKALREAQVGDTVTDAKRPAKEALPGYREPKPMVFAGLYPMQGDDYPALRDALDKLRLNDAALIYEPETSKALGFGFRLGFLGLLHMEITRERLEREFNLELVATAPTVGYRVQLTNGSEIIVSNPSDMPDPHLVERIAEPSVSALILSPKEYIGTLMELCMARRGVLDGMHYLSADRVELRYRLPLSEIIFDFFDQLKARTRGYASLDYEPIGYQPADLVRLDLLINAEPVDAFSAIVHREKASVYGRNLAEKLRELIPRQMFDVPIQAAIGSKIVARETVKAKRKDVLAKCYGGDITRKRKLLEKQKEGKRRMKQIGSVEVPQEAFIAALRVGSEEK
ncbi:MAG: translation elongation factor 4 [Actinomycetota bacterium]|nr:translation elongation factor 4 [Actinomycetota bacterium]